MIPCTVYDEEHEQLRGSVRRFLEDEVMPHRAFWKKARQVDRDL